MTEASRPAPDSGGWLFSVDRGGTFTDVVARRPDGSLAVAKLLSDDPGRYEDATLAAIRLLMGLGRGEAIPAGAITEVRLGTTVATNALLERRGAVTALAVTAGFADALRIGYQNRPKLFERQIVLPPPLYRSVAEVVERVDAGGRVLVPLERGRTRRALCALARSGAETLAIALLHSHLRPEHELAVAEIGRDVGFSTVVCSHEASPLPRFIARGDTAVVEAYLSPVLRRYLDGLSAALPGVRVSVMQSNGGLADLEVITARDAILSGPAGGIVGMARSSAAAGHQTVIGLDMGGTSTDLSHYANGFERVGVLEVAGVRVQAPALEIHTVASGGGSVLRVDGARLRVGPGSAGADPGPACYRRGGPPTLTDANLVLGRIQPDSFPAVLGPGGDERLDLEQSRVALARLAVELDVSSPSGSARAPEDAAAAFVEVAVAAMAQAIKRISIRRGRDVADYALCCFGGAGSQHACAVADELGISTVIVPPLAGVLSAVGVSMAALSTIREAAVEEPLGEASTRRTAALADELAAAARASLVAAGAEATRLRRGDLVRLRYSGTDTAIEVPLGAAATMRAGFEDRHEQLHSFRTPGREVIVESVSVELVEEGADPFALAGAALEPDIEATPGGEADEGGARGRSAAHSTSGGSGTSGGHLAPSRQVRLYLDGNWRPAPLHRRRELEPGRRITGPALVVEEHSTTVIDHGWTGEVLESGHIRLRRGSGSTPWPRNEAAGRRTAVVKASGPDPVRLEVFAGLLMSVAEQMGGRLQATARSVNIKERLDFSCAVFDATGALVANAPHMPVHLGSMGESVSAVLAAHGRRIRPGDSYALNDPFHGGTHLPDITVVSPFFSSGSLLGWVASRGHHAEIGGLTPGSMPPHSRHVAEEGVLIDCWPLVRDGRMHQQETLALLSGGRFPSRAPEVNLADLRAQVAANDLGLAELEGLVERYGASTLTAYLGHVIDEGEAAIRRLLPSLSGGRYHYETDRGSVIEVAVRVDAAAGEATIDFTGSSPQREDNFNAPRSVTMAAVLYVFRTLLEGDLPLNDGCRRPLRVILPDDCFLAARHPAATVGGNVETSQAVTGALYGALRVLGEGSGTMNNVTLGNERFQYYETVASGSGAGPGFDGADAVQTHMTNSRLTDPEVLESRVPVLVEEFAVRRGSGGRGRWHGGDGAIRRLRLLEPATVSVVASNRRLPPYGMEGGEPGAIGHQRLERAGGEVIELAASDSVDGEPGDVFVIETPGGGGYGTLATPHDRS